MKKRPKTQIYISHHKNSESGLDKARHGVEQNRPLSDILKREGLGMMRQILPYITANE